MSRTADPVAAFRLPSDDLRGIRAIADARGTRPSVELRRAARAFVRAERRRLGL